LHFLVFSGYLEIWYSNPHPDLPSFLKFFAECWQVGTLQWQVGIFQLRYSLNQKGGFDTFVYYWVIWLFLQKKNIFGPVLVWA